MQIGTRRRLPHALGDQIEKRHVDPPAAFVADIELNLFDRRDRLRNAVVGLSYRGEVGNEYASGDEFAEDELASQRRDAPVIGKAGGDPRPPRVPLVVIVDRHGVGKSVLYPPVQNLRWKRI